MLLETLAGLLASERDTVALRRELNAAHNRVRVVEQELEAVRGQPPSQDARQRWLEASEDVERLRQELDAAGERVRALEASKLWRLRGWYHKSRDRIASVVGGRSGRA